MLRWKECVLILRYECHTWIWLELPVTLSCATCLKFRLSSVGASPWLRQRGWRTWGTACSRAPWCCWRSMAATCVFCEDTATCRRKRRSVPRQRTRRNRTETPNVDLHNLCKCISFFCMFLLCLSKGRVRHELSCGEAICTIAKLSASMWRWTMDFSGCSKWVYSRRA